jgi:hypothetical protein
MYRVPRRYQDIREGEVRMAGKDTARGWRTHIHNQELGRRLRVNAFSDFYLFIGLLSAMRMKMNQQQIYII